MTKNYATNAINIKAHNLSESDKIVVMYSRDLGLIRGVARGVKKPTSRLGGRMDLLVANKVFMARGKSLDIVSQADVLNSFRGIRKDFDKMAYAMYCTELISIFGVENDANSTVVYDLFFETLNKVDKSQLKEELLFSIIKFQLELMDISGYAIELDTCVCCNKEIDENTFAFCIQSGGIICSECKELYDRKLSLNEALRENLKQIKLNRNTDFGALNLDLCFNLLKEYISCRSHKKMKSLDLLNSCC